MGIKYMPGSAKHRKIDVRLICRLTHYIKDYPALIGKFYREMCPFYSVSRNLFLYFSLFSFFFFHRPVSDQNDPYVSACFGNHQHPRRRHCLSEQYHRNIACKTYYNRNPQESKRPVLLLCRTSVKQKNNQGSQDHKWNIAVNSPGNRRIRTGPLILRHKTQQNTHNRKHPHGGCDPLLPADLVTTAPHIIKQYLKQSHGIISLPTPSAVV